MHTFLALFTRLHHQVSERQFPMICNQWDQRDWRDQVNWVGPTKSMKVSLRNQTYHRVNEINSDSKVNGVDKGGGAAITTKVAEFKNTMRSLTKFFYCANTYSSLGTHTRWCDYARSRYSESGVAKGCRNLVDINCLYPFHVWYLSSGKGLYTKPALEVWSSKFRVPRDFLMWTWTMLINFTTFFNLLSIRTDERCIDELE